MHFVKAKSILSSKNGINIYRGCSHGCIYCDSRSICYNMSHSFEDIEVKENAPELLRNALIKKRQKCMIGTGSMTDPYIPIEKELRYTRKCIEIIDEMNFGLTILTKSSLILRDLDILKNINKNSKCVVQMTLTTFDEKLCKILEPNTSSTYERFKTLEAMHDANIPTIVWLCPILPYINDSEENLICIYHNADCKRTMAAIADALPYMDSDMQPLSEQVLEKLRSMSDTAFEDAVFHMTLSDE